MDQFFATNRRAGASKKRVLLTAMRISRFIPALFLGIAAVLPALAFSRTALEEPKDAHAAAEAAHLRVEILIPERDLSAGNAHHAAGLYFKLEPGWHVYWKNAGDSGEPPRMKWTLPTGISATPLQFPAPKRLPLGPLMDFGYEGEVLFPFKVTVADSAKPGWAILHAKVDWLVCQASCIPRKAALEVTRGIASQPSKAAFVPQDLDLFKGLSSRLPKPLPEEMKVIFQPTKEGFRLSVDTGRRETSATFFPADQDVIQNPAPQTLTPTPNGLTLDLKKDANLTADPTELKGVLELSGGRAYDIAAAAGTLAQGASPSAPASPAASPAASAAAPKSAAPISSPRAASSPLAAAPATEPAPSPMGT